MQNDILHSVLDEVDSSSIHCAVPGLPIDANKEDALWNWENIAWKEAIRDDASGDVKTHYGGSQPL